MSSCADAVATLGNGCPLQCTHAYGFTFVQLTDVKPYLCKKNCSVYIQCKDDIVVVDINSTNHNLNIQS